MSDVLLVCSLIPEIESKGSKPSGSCGASTKVNMLHCCIQHPHHSPVIPGNSHLSAGADAVRLSGLPSLLAALDAGRDDGTANAHRCLCEQLSPTSCFSNQCSLYWMIGAAMILGFFFYDRWENDSQHLCPAVSDCVPAGHRGADSLHLQRSASDWQVHAVHHGVRHRLDHHHRHRHQHPPPLPQHAHHAPLGQEGELCALAHLLVSTKCSIFYWQVF